MTEQQKNQDTGNFVGGSWSPDTDSMGRDAPPWQKIIVYSALFLGSGMITCRLIDIAKELIFRTETRPK